MSAAPQLPGGDYVLVADWGVFLTPPDNSTGLVLARWVYARVWAFFAILIGFGYARHFHSAPRVGALFLALGIAFQGLFYVQPVFLRGPETWPGVVRLANGIISLLCLFLAWEAYRRYKR